MFGFGKKAKLAKLENKAAAGDLDAKYQLADALMSEGTKESCDRAEELFLEAGRAGHEDSQAMLASFAYFSWIDEFMDDPTEKKRLLWAIEMNNLMLKAGNVDSIRKHQNLCEKMLEVVDTYGQSAKDGDADAMFEIGNVMLNDNVVKDAYVTCDMGVDVLEEQAEEWLQRAADAGSAKAREMLENR